ncbi:hypothetical protein HYU14_02495 [Candidatus Woesearchaeota archaeon]|nr:hypothetical protein [Candidatus Woesearchaeota archaeon]
MSQIIADGRGRVTLGAGITEKYGKKFYLIEAAGELVLIPIPKDPLRHLQEMGKRAGIDRHSLKELKQMGREEAEREAMGHVRRY